MQSLKLNWMKINTILKHCYKKGKKSKTFKKKKEIFKQLYQTERVLVKLVFFKSFKQVIPFFKITKMKGYKKDNYSVNHFMPGSGNLIVFKWFLQEVSVIQRKRSFSADFCRQLSLAYQNKGNIISKKNNYQKLVEKVK